MSYTAKAQMRLQEDALRLEAEHGHRHELRAMAMEVSSAKELSDIIVVSTRPGQPGTKAILECTPPDSDDRESQEDETEQPEDRRKTLITVNLSALSMPVQDDDPYEDEEEEDQESDELVVVEDKPYISHKQAQSVRLLGILENIERRVCFAPRAPHLTLPPGAPGASEPSRPRTSPFFALKTWKQGWQDKVSQSYVGSGILFFSSHNSGHWVRCRHATSYSGFEEKSNTWNDSNNFTCKTSMGCPH